MPNLLVAAAYDRLADRWLDEHFDQSNGVAQHLRALAFLSGAEGGKALNVGCGCNTRFNALVRSRGLCMEGIDVSARMVTLARQRDPAMAVVHADVCDWPLPCSYHFITAWDSIWHVGLSRHRELMRKLLHALAPGGVLIFSAGGLSAPDEHRSAAMGPELPYSTLGIPELLRVVLEAGCVVRHLEFEQAQDKHVFLIVQRERK